MAQDSIDVFSSSVSPIVPPIITRRADRRLKTRFICKRPYQIGENRSHESYTRRGYTAEDLIHPFSTPLH